MPCTCWTLNNSTGRSTKTSRESYSPGRRSYSLASFSLPSCHHHLQHLSFRLSPSLHSSFLSSSSFFFFSIHPSPPSNPSHFIHHEWIFPLSSSYSFSSFSPSLPPLLPLLPPHPPFLLQVNPDQGITAIMQTEEIKKKCLTEAHTIVQKTNVTQVPAHTFNPCNILLHFSSPVERS